MCFALTHIEGMRWLVGEFAAGQLRRSFPLPSTREFQLLPVTPSPTWTYPKPLHWNLLAQWDHEQLLVG